MIDKCLTIDLSAVGSDIPTQLGISRPTLTRVHDLPTLRVCCRWRLQCCGEYSPRGDGTALRACGARTSASHLCGASAGHEAGSPALEARGSSRMNADDNLDVENEAC